MSDYLEQNNSHYYLQLFADDMRLMAAQAYRWGQVETGGTLYGLWSHAGRPVILLATPQGPGACNETTHFAQDPDHVYQVTQQLQQQFGLQYIGNWHSHHSLGLDHPSGGDVEQVHRVAGKSNMSRMVQIIFTRTREATSSGADRFSGGDSSFARDANREKSGWIATLNKSHSRQDAGDTLMQMNTFIYPEAQQGSYCLCPVNVLGAPNPIRVALAGGEFVDFSETPFPLEKILYEGLSGSAAKINSQKGVQKFVAEQLGSLADDISEQTDIFIDEEMLYLSIPIEDKKIVVAYKSKLPGYRLCSVGLVGNDKQILDMTDDLLNEKEVLSVCDIYEQAKKWLRTDKPISLIDQCRESENVGPKNKPEKQQLKHYTESERRSLPCGHEPNNFA